MSIPVDKSRAQCSSLQIVDGEKNLSEVVMKEKPRSSTIVCIQYFPSGDYSWLSPSDVKPLPKHEIDAYLKNSTSKKTTGDLYLSYEIAAHPKEWIAEREEERAVVAEQERIAALKAAKKGKEPAEDEDELADEDDEEEPAAKSGGKRKRIAADKKTPKKEPASKRAKADKAPAKKSGKSKDTAEEAAPVSKKAANSKAAANSKKAPASTGKKDAPTSAAKEAKESKEDAEDDAMSKDPEAVRVRDWRHKLQRAFLSKSVPSAEEMDTYDRLFTTIENYQNMTVAYLAHSKIGKVMKKIAALTNIPKNDELKITDRAHALMQKWTDQIDNGKPAEAVGNGDVDANGKSEETVAGSKEEPAKDQPSKEESAKEDAAKENAAEDKMDTENEKKDETTVEDSADKEDAPIFA
ncbi:hypothetical protein QFC19_006725 [Naganishia cerealis]|uniref:Uncharacterized protein n=1 Tax=Naganishia cerealis TaxID=610337 RepID=A0ACC2VEQ3_9TREE|nr:hypothetical protein QFC19_006725 [Naganishia cerealis]